MEVDPTLPILTELFDSIPLGIIVLDTSGRVIIYNRAEELLASRKREDVVGREFFVEVAPCMNVRQLGGEFRSKIGRERLNNEVEFSFPFPFLNEPRDVKVRMNSFEVQALTYCFLTVEDVSKERSVERMKETLQDLIVHDLKNPLTVMLANLGYLEQEQSVRDGQDTLQAVEETIRATERLGSMVVNLLDITRLETNSLPLKRRTVDLRQLVSATANAAAAVGRMRSATVEADVSSGLIEASIDEDVLRRALENLVDNALRYAKAVTIGASVRDTNIVLFVRDNGPGIPQPVRDRIFDKYAQVVGGGATSHNRGLGLTFVRLAARAHGGDATVQCPASGGSLFELTFPATPP